MAEDNKTTEPTPAGTPPGGSAEMRRRKRLSASNATAYVLLAAGAVVAVNLIATRVFGRFDLTENKVYTLSQGSKDVVAALPDYLTVKAYISSDLPPELKASSRYVRDLLDDYRTYSKGKLRFEALDPGTDKKIEDEASQCKVQRMQIQVLRQQKFEVGGYYLGLCFQYQGKNEAIPELGQTEGLEYGISSLIKRMTQKKHKVAFTSGHGESDLNQGYTFLKHAIEQEFDTTSINPSTTPIPEDADALVVGGPKQAFDDKGRREIDAFLMKGKGAIFLVDGMVMSSPGSRGMPEGMPQPKIGQANDAGLGELLEKYGFKVGQDFVLDAKQNVPGPIDVGGQRRVANLPMYVGVKTQGGDDKDMTVMAGINAMVFPYASSLELVGPLAGGKVPQNGKLWLLAQSSPAAWKQSGFFFFSPTTRIEEGKEKGAVPLAYAYQGTLKSAYAPAAAPGMSDPSTPASESKKPVRLLVVGDSDFASDEYLQWSRYFPLYEGGARVLLNSIGWMLEDEALTPVRTKTLAARTITVESDSTVTAVKAINIAGVPLAFIGFGLLRSRVRRARRQGLKL